MSNVLQNAGFLSQMLIFGIVFSIIISILFLVNTELRTTLIDTYDFSYLGNVYNVWGNTTEYLQQGVHFLFAFFTAISLLSSAIERQNIITYMTRFIIVLLFSSVMVFVLSQVTTHLMGDMPVWVSWDYIPVWFLSNWSSILVVNVLAFLSGFIFVKIRGATVGGATI